jgi:predicted NAD/FAD-binding protein
MESIAIIGTGIAGMGCGYFLNKQYDLTFYEENDYVGGHTNTITIDEQGKPVYIDTGFMVFNHVTYPNLLKLFNLLKVETKKTDMSFSVQHVPSGLEYCGSGLNGLFAQRKNIFSPRFIRMLLNITSFNKDSDRILSNPDFAYCTIADYVKLQGYGDDFLFKYLIPMSAAVWSTPIEKMLDFPITTLVQFFKNHGFLGLNTQHQWYTVHNGSKSYRDLLIAPFKEKIQVKNGARSVKRENGKVTVLSADGTCKTFDRVILACHADHALQLLENPSENESRILSKFQYEKNKAILHTDTSIMPKTKAAWSSWNYRMENKDEDIKPSTIYYMNSLQQVSDKRDYFVSINDCGSIHEEHILKEINYEHPLFSVQAIQAQKELYKLNDNNTVNFCGSYFNYGFHEDAFTSAVQLCEKITGKKNW